MHKEDDGEDVMAGKFLSPAGMQDTILTERRSNSRRRRNGISQHPTRTITCGCPAKSCGAFFVTMDHIIIPTSGECKKLLALDNERRKPPKKACDPKHQVLSCVHMSRKRV
jgi:hypothetical protein